MITRRQAEVARDSLSAVFGPDGMEVTVLDVHPTFDSVVGTDNWDTERNVYQFDELDPSRDVLALERKG